MKYKIIKTKCPYCGNEYAHLLSHMKKCGNSLPLNVIEMDSLKARYGNNIIKNICDEYVNKNYSLPMFHKKYGMNPEHVFKILDFNNIKHRSLKTAIKTISIPKSKITCKKKYGVEYIFQSNEYKENLKKIFINKYGVDNPSKVDIIKQRKIETCRKNFGVDYPFQSKEIKEKSYKTSLEKYGVPLWSMTKEGILNSHSKKANQKRVNTFLKNKSYIKSKTENLAFLYLSLEYPDIIRQYYDKERYPYKCDFYIPCLDLFIELNNSQYHHFHAFDKTNESDINEFNRIKKLSEEKHKISDKKNQYDNIIYTWTILDPEKRKVAKENNINFIEFWDINEVINWLK